ncbi:MAG TPA: cobyrinate a,c-diamide synthase [Xanthobacteraceae bacterium]|nr:cobyrinate a,c-diamide synthase [Xanthobacteraceae bacterium]
MSGRGLIVAAARSGAGKTVITLALLAALRRRGVAVRAAKTGPDYIDPGFHAAATGAAGCNLDSWAMPPALLDALVVEALSGAEILVIEGVMGLFDGVTGAPGRCGTTADLAARFALPVLLVLDVAGQSQSAAAVLRGFATHDPAVRIAGVILNRVGSERHQALVSDAITALRPPTPIPVLGCVPRAAALELPERHLGLVQAREHADLDRWLDRLADMAERHLDLDAVMAGAAPLPRPQLTPSGGGATAALPVPGQRIALAHDQAFSFVYPHLLDGWRRAGAEIVTFSPLADEPPPDDCDAGWLPGGYPELHAGALAAAARFRAGLARFAQTRPIHGECGGYMVLGESLTDADGKHHAMTGLLGHATSFAQRKLQLGYREARMLVDSPIGSAGSAVRGHEFHYATLISSGEDAPLADLMDGQGRPLGPSGGRRGRVTGTFFHAIAQA